MQVQNSVRQGIKINILSIEEQNHSTLFLDLSPNNKRYSIQFIRSVVLGRVFFIDADMDKIKQGHFDTGFTGVSGSNGSDSVFIVSIRRAIVVHSTPCSEEIGLDGDHNAFFRMLQLS